MPGKQIPPGDLVQGTLDMLILKTLARGSLPRSSLPRSSLPRGSLHGYAIAEFVHQASDDVLKVEEGALYPALHRLELRGLLDAEWGVSENNRRAKFYRLTKAGRKALAQETEHWDRMTRAIARVMQTA